MKDYDKPMIIDEEDTPSPLFFVAVNAMAIVNVAAAINSVFAVNVYIRGVAVDTYSSKFNVLKG